MSCSKIYYFYGYDDHQQHQHDTGVAIIEFLPQPTRWVAPTHKFKPKIQAYQPIRITE